MRTVVHLCPKQYIIERHLETVVYHCANVWVPVLCIKVVVL